MRMTHAQRSAYEQISKDYFYRRGGFARSDQFRRMIDGYWIYFLILR